MKISRRELMKELNDTPISTILGKGVSDSLTHKQKQFALEVAKGKTKADAYRKAYKPDAAPSSLRNDPYRIASDPRIVREIEAYQVAIEAAKHRTPAALRELVISGLVEVALNPDTKDAVRVQALRTIGTITEVSAFTERKEVRTISSSETAKATIMAQLQTLLSGEVSDVQAKDAESLLAELAAPITRETTLETTLENGTDVPASETEREGEKRGDVDPTHPGESADGFGVPQL